MTLNNSRNNSQTISIIQCMRQRRTFLPPHTLLRGGGGGEVQAKCDGVPGGDGGETLAHRRGIHRPGGRSDHGDGGQGDRTQAAGSGTDGGGGF